jgi:hypothetical protein
MQCSWAECTACRRLAVTPGAGIGLKEVGVELGRAWKELSDEDKKPFVVRACDR